MDEHSGVIEDRPHPSHLGMTGLKAVSPGSYHFLWLSLLLFPLLAIAFLLPLTPQDYWWYLPLGRGILATGSVPSVDTFSFPSAGQPIYYQAWLAAVVFWLVHKAGGLALTFLLRGVLLALTYGLLWRLMRKLGAGTQLAAGVTFLAALASSNNWSVRPQLLVYPLFVLTLWLLYGWLRGEQNRLWPLPLISLLWCNLHGSYVLFFILLGTALLLGTGDRKRLLLWLLASAAVMFLNPRGPGLLFDTLDMLRSPSNQSFSTEWSPPVNLGWQMNLFFGWLLMLAPLAAWSPRKLSRLEWSWMLVFGWMALSGTRYVIWFLLLMALYTAGWLADWGRKFLDRPRPEGSAFLNISIGLLLLLGSLSLLPGLRERWWAAAPLPYESATTPVRAAEWLSAHPELPGPMLSDYAFSSYLEYALPERPVWIDTRFSNYPAAHWQRFQSLAAADPAWPALLDEEGINLVLLAEVTEPHLIAAMRTDPAWCEQYADADAVLFARCVPLP
ncbi:MAG TPA: hypothetical protein VIV15_13735 [Anaerolineales bacterium]